MYRFMTYNRVSTELQGREGTSLDWQRESQVDAGKARGWHHVEDVFDRGQSGAKLERDGVRRTMELLAAGDVNVVSIFKVDRAARAQRVFEDFWTSIYAVGGRVYLHDKGRLYESLEDLMRDTVFDRAVAEHERYSILGRSDDGMEQHLKHGSYVFRAIYGYFIKRERSEGFNANVLEVDVERARIVQLIFELMIEGKSYSQVAKELNARGHVSKFRKPWTISKVQNVVTNARLYAGESFERTRTVRGKEYTITYRYPAVISHEQLVALEEERATRQAKHRRKGGDPLPFPGAVFCACGRRANRLHDGNKRGFGRVNLQCSSRYDEIREVATGNAEEYGESTCRHHLNANVLRQRLQVWLQTGGYTEAVEAFQVRVVAYQAIAEAHDRKLEKLRARYDAMTQRMLKMSDGQFETLAATFEEELRRLNEEIDRTREQKMTTQRLREALSSTLSRLDVSAPTPGPDDSLRSFLEALRERQLGSKVDELVEALESGDVGTANRLVFRLGIRSIVDFSIKQRRERHASVTFRVDLPEMPSGTAQERDFVEL